MVWPRNAPGGPQFLYCVTMPRYPSYHTPKPAVAGLGIHERFPSNLCARAADTQIGALATRFALSEWFMAECSARSVIRPHGEEARARDGSAMVLMFRARAVSNHEGGPCLPTSSFETYRTVGKCRLCDIPHDEVGTGNR